MASFKILNHGGRSWTPDDKNNRGHYNGCNIHSQCSTSHQQHHKNISQIMSVFPSVPDHTKAILKVQAQHSQTTGALGCQQHLVLLILCINIY